MAYVPVPKDLSKVKTKVAFNLTKRQILCFSVALLMGLPLFFLFKDSAGTSLAAMAMIVVMLPCFLVAMYEKHGQPLEVVVKNIIQTKLTRPKVRPYRSLHLTIRLPVFFAEKEIHVPVEIQLRTIAMDFWASLEHTIRYKKNLPINTEIETELKECADSSREWDGKMEHLQHIIT